MPTMIEPLLTLDWNADAAGASPPGSRLNNWLKLPDQLAAVARAKTPAAWVAAILDVARQSRSVLDYSDRLRGVAIDLMHETVVVTVAIVAASVEPLPSVEAELPVRTWHSGPFGLRAPEATGPDGHAIAVRTTAQIVFPLATVAATATLVMTDDKARLPEAAREVLEDLAEQINQIAAPIAATFAPPTSR
jgi:hypothetical protein